MVIPSLKKPRWFPQSRDEAGRFFFLLMLGTLGLIVTIEIACYALKAFNYLLAVLFFNQVRLFQFILFILCIFSFFPAIIFSQKLFPKIGGGLLLGWCVLKSEFLFMIGVLSVGILCFDFNAHWLSSYPNPFYSNLFDIKQALLYTRRGSPGEYIVTVQTAFTLPQTIFVQEECSPQKPVIRWIGTDTLQIDRLTLKVPGPTLWKDINYCFEMDSEQRQ